MGCHSTQYVGFRGRELQIAIRWKMGKISGPDLGTRNKSHRSLGLVAVPPAGICTLHNWFPVTYCTTTNMHHDA